MNYFIFLFFRVKNYLKKYAFNNAAQDNLWTEFTRQGHADKTLDASLSIKDIMDTWTLKKGYPLVTVTRRDDSPHLLRVKQEWFLLNRLSKYYDKEESKFYSNYKWYVPFTFTTKTLGNYSFESRPYWLKPNESELIINLVLDIKNMVLKILKSK